VHIEDISRAFLAVLGAPREVVHDEAFNVGRMEDNVQVKDIADLVRAAVPGSMVWLAEDAGPDLRNYRVDFSKLAATFPDLGLRWRVPDGVNELVGAYARHGLTYDDFMSSRFVRLRRIRELVSASLVDEMLRRQASGPFSMPGAEIAHEARLYPMLGPRGGIGATECRVVTAVGVPGCGPESAGTKAGDRAFARPWLASRILSGRKQNP
jgi:hypothetical protein